MLLGLNTILGSGIFLLPNQMMALVGPASLWVILFDAILAATIALCFAEAAGYFKRSGGAYVYAREAFGEFVGFEVGFIKWIVSIIAWASLAVGLVTALGGVLPVLNTPWVANTFLVLFIGALGFLNLFGVDVSKLVNNVITVGKLLPLIFFMAVGIFFIRPEHFTPLFSFADAEVGSFGAAALLFLYTFTGFEALTVAAGDMENPKKHLPRAIVMIMVILSVGYFWIQAVAIGVLGPQLSQATAPLAEGARVFSGSWGYALIMAGTVVSIAGVNAAAAFITPRVGEALAEDGLVPRFIGKRNRWDVPAWAIIISTLLTIVVALSGSFQQLVLISAVSRFAQYLPTCLSVIVLRQKMKDRPSTFHVPGGAMIPIIAILASIWLLGQVSWQELIWGLGGLVLGVPLYFFTQRSR